MIAILAGKEGKLLALACAAHDSAVMLSENHLTGVCLFLSCRRIFHWQGVLKFKPEVVSTRGDILVQLLSRLVRFRFS